MAGKNPATKKKSKNGLQTLQNKELPPLRGACKPNIQELRANASSSPRNPALKSPPASNVKLPPISPPSRSSVKLPSLPSVQPKCPGKVSSRNKLAVRRSRPDLQADLTAGKSLHKVLPPSLIRNASKAIAPKEKIDVGKMSGLTTTFRLKTQCRQISSDMINTQKICHGYRIAGRSH